MDILPKADEAVIPIQKLAEYSLNPIKNKDKAIAFKEALGYDLHNLNILVDSIHKGLNVFPVVYKGSNEYGKSYAVLMELTGPNGKAANVMTAWLDDSLTGEIRLTSVYVKKRKKDSNDKIIR
jgi:ribosome-binding ATPase YchF (GTP1/OBG family)